MLVANGLQLFPFDFELLTLLRHGGDSLPLLFGTLKAGCDGGLCRRVLALQLIEHRLTLQQIPFYVF